MDTVEIIRKKRDGLENSFQEISWLVDGLVAGTIPRYQATAWLMAVYQRGMSPAETALLTRALTESGTVLDLSDLWLQSRQAFDRRCR